MMMKSLFTLCSFAAVVTSIGNMQAADVTKNIIFEKKLNDYHSHIVAIDNTNHEFVGDISYNVPLCSIKYVWVVEKMRNKGIGSNLFRQAVNDMSDCEHIKWTVNPTTVDFCLKQGAKIDSVFMIFDNKQQQQ